MLKICETCANSAWRDGKSAVTEVCLACTFSTDGQPTRWKLKPMTNADRFRAMTDDEELATALLDMFEKLCENGVPSKEWMTMWLKWPVEGNDG